MGCGFKLWDTDLWLYIFNLTLAELFPLNRFEMRITNLQFIRLVNYIIICFQLKTLIHSEGRDFSVRHGSLLISWDGKRDLTWDMKWLSLLPNDAFSRNIKNIGSYFFPALWIYMYISHWIYFFKNIEINLTLLNTYISVTSH